MVPSRCLRSGSGQTTKSRAPLIDIPGPFAASRSAGGASLEHVIVRCEIFRRLHQHSALFDLGHANRQGPGDLGRDLVLQGKDVDERLVEAG
jgi:hypothetical protein